MRRTRSWIFTALLALTLTAFLYFAYHGKQVFLHGPAAGLRTDLAVVPYYALRSFLRMLAAYVLSFAFSVIYGYAAGANRRAEKLLLPILDILQSVPILGFFPAAIYFFVALFRGSVAGVEVASIFLIFTSQAWNMTFGFYESMTTIPSYLGEAMDAYGVSGFLRFRRLFFPASIPKLVYNSIMSWAGGWYFLIAAEIIAIGPVRYSLPGLGSYLVQTAEKGELGATVVGLLTLVSMIVALDVVVWRPLSVWAENFKYEFSTGAVRESLFYDLWKHSPLLRLVRRLASRLGSRAVGLLNGWVLAMAGWRTRSRVVNRGVVLLRTAVGAGLIGLLAYVSARGGLAILSTLRHPLAPEARLIPAGMLFSLLRLVAAYLISLAWTLPCAIWISHSERVYELLTPVFEVAASVPATALFPIIVLLLARLTGGMTLASILLVLTGMQWYLLFNLIGGVRSIPNDLREAAAAYGLKGPLYWRRVVIPALLPSLITGSITAWGGGWNALIVSEYVVYAGHTYQAFGIGSILDRATYATGDFQTIWLSLAAMVVVIVAMNRLLWRRLYEYVANRYRIEY